MKLHIGKRIWKTAIAVLVCFFIYYLRNEQSFPFFSIISAILCMQAYVGNVWNIARNQLLGTFVGAAYGIIVLCLFQYVFPSADKRVMIVVISLFIIPAIKTAVLIGRAEMSNFVCVVFLCMTMYLFHAGDAFMYVADRILDTIVGITVALVINSVNLPRKKRKELLFVSDFDDTMMTENKRLTPYSQVELNRLIAEGINFTVSTEQTPASLVIFFTDLELNLPVIAMNGAVLYDIGHNKYIHKAPLERELVGEIRRLLDREEMGCFYNTLIQDTLLIYFEDFKNMAMQELYRDLRTSPYRNYVRGRLPDNVGVLYLYVIDDTPRINRLIQVIKESDCGKKVRLVTGKEKQYFDRSYLKIYNRDATTENMIAYLKQVLDAEKVITFGCEEGKYDFTITDGNEDRVVRIVKSLYRPFIWQQSTEVKMQRLKEKMRKR